jgi:hypothetical protein
MSDPTDDIEQADQAIEAKGKEKESQGTEIVKLALEAGIELFHSPEGHAFATLPIDGRRETWPLRTKAIRRWLSRLYYKSAGKAASSEGTQSALGVLEGMALFDGTEHPVHLRTAELDGVLYLDLADAEWRAVEITPEGWRIVVDPPVKFRRARGMLPLPTPVGGGSLEELRPFLNYAREDDFRLMVAWLVMALRPAGPYPVLALHGEQGSGKSTAAEVLRMIFDPNEALLRPPPRDERDLVIAGSNGRVVALENLSHIPQWVSDALCRISTGSGFGTRELYSDNEETLFAVQLPIAINGIAEVIISGDLQDRSIILMLPVIEEYISETDLWERFERAQPRLLGALLDVVSEAMCREPEVELGELPRMADFARWTAAAAPALGWGTGELLAAYTRNRAEANETVLAASPLTAPLRAVGNFEGTASELLDRLVGQVGDGVARSKVWPKTPSALSNSLRRLAPSLRRGDPAWGVAFERDARERIVVTGQAEWVRKRPSSASSPSFGPPDDAHDGDDGDLHTHSGPGVEEPLTVACPHPSHHPSWDDGRCSICGPEAAG